MLCKYKDIFGKPGEGVHKYRVGNIAIVDVLATIVLAWFLSSRLHSSFFYMIIILFLISIIVHQLFCVPKTVRTAKHNN